MARAREVRESCVLILEFGRQFGGSVGSCLQAQRSPWAETPTHASNSGSWSAGQDTHAEPQNATKVVVIE